MYDSLLRDDGRFLKCLMAMVLAGVLIWADCGKVDEKEEIKERLRTIASQAEKKESGKILSFMTPDYRDFQGRDLEQTAALLDYYFKNYHGIAIHLLDVYVDIDGQRAEAEADVLLSSGPLESLRRLVGIVGSYYRFDFQLEKSDGRWLIKSAAWREIDSSQLLPGSTVILRKLFPEKY